MTVDDLRRWIAVLVMPKCDREALAYVGSTTPAFNKLCHAWDYLMKTYGIDERDAMRLLLDCQRKLVHGG